MIDIFLFMIDICFSLLYACLCAWMSIFCWERVERPIMEVLFAFLKFGNQYDLNHAIVSYQPSANGIIGW